MEKVTYEDFKQSGKDDVDAKHREIIETCEGLSNIIDDLTSSQLKQLVKGMLAYPALSTLEEYKIDDAKSQDLFNISCALLKKKFEVIYNLMLVSNVSEEDFNTIKQNHQEEKSSTLTKEESDEQ